MIECKGCGAQKPRDQFYSSNGSKCKVCVREMVRKNREDKPDYYREYDKRRFQDDPKVKERHKRYQATEAGKASMQRSRRRWLAQNSDKRAAHIILGNAVYSGRVEKPDACSACGGGGRIHGHHEDYALPLEVVWLCSLCHVDVHRKQMEKV